MFVCLCEKTRLCSFQRENYVMFSLKTEREAESERLLIIIKQVATVEILVICSIRKQITLFVVISHVLFDHIDVYYIFIHIR